MHTATAESTPRGMCGAARRCEGREQWAQPIPRPDYLGEQDGVVCRDGVAVLVQEVEHVIAHVIGVCNGAGTIAGKHGSASEPDGAPG